MAIRNSSNTLNNDTELTIDCNAADPTAEIDPQKKQYEKSFICYIKDYGVNDEGEEVGRVLPHPFFIPRNFKANSKTISYLPQEEQQLAYDFHAELKELLDSMEAGETIELPVTFVIKKQKDKKEVKPVKAKFSSLKSLVKRVE